VLAAAFPTESTIEVPLSGAPLLFLVADALEEPSSRLSDVAAMHDLGCLVKGCKEQAAQTEVSQMQRLIGSLHDPVKLGAALLAANSDHVRSEWKGVFDAVHARHAAITGAIGQAGGSSALVEALPADASLPLRAFSDLVVSSKRLSDHFLEKGTFRSDQGTLRAGLNRDRKVEIEQIVRDRMIALTNRIATYRGARAQYAADLLAEYRNERDQQSIMERLNRNLADTKSLANDLEGIRLFAAQDEVRFGSLTAAYQEELATFDALSDYYVNVAPLEAFSVTPLDARYVHVDPPGVRSWELGELSTSWSDTADVPKLQVAAGEIVRFAISGDWSPTCSIRSAEYAGIAPLRYQLTGAEGAMTGPEGFTTVFENGAFRTDSVSRTRSSTFFSACEGLSISFIVSAGVETCASLTRSHTHSTGTEERVGTSFAQGLRLANTPVPWAPTGSLLLVRMPVGETNLGRAQDVLVLERDSAIVMPEAADLFLVVNDAAGCSNVPGQLSVTATRFTPFGAIAQKVGTAMAEAQVELRALADLHVKEGRLLPATMTALRATAEQALRRNCGFDSSGFPPEVKGFWDLWVSHEVARAERLVELANVVRQQDLARIETAGLVDDLERASGEGRLLRLVPAWTLQNLDADRLRADAAALTAAFNDSFFPFVRLLYPETLTAIRQEQIGGAVDNAREAVEALVAMDWTSPYDVHAAQLVDAADQVMAKLGALSFPPFSAFDVAVEFVRPGHTTEEIWARADPERSRALWDQIVSDDPALTRDRRAVLATIRPEDLYAAVTGNATLLCTHSAPIIRTMGLFVTSSYCGDLNDYYRSVQTRFGPGALRIPTAEGVERFDFEDATGWLNPPLGVSCGVVTDAWETFAASPAYGRLDGAGLPPFNDAIALDLSSFNTGTDYLSYADSLVLWFRVEPRQIAWPGVTGVSSCP
jgi:hypothetical protein